MLAKGTFEVKLTSQSEDKAEVSTIGRFLLEKKYRGDLEGESTGEMLSALSALKVLPVMLPSSDSPELSAAWLAPLSSSTVAP